LCYNLAIKRGDRVILDSQLRSLRFNYMQALSKLKLERTAALEVVETEEQIEAIEQKYLLDKKNLDTNYREKQQELIELGNAFQYFGFSVGEDISISQVNSVFKRKRFELINAHNQMVDENGSFSKEKYEKKLQKLDGYFELVKNYYQKEEAGEATQVIAKSEAVLDPVSLWISKVEKLPDGRELPWTLAERVNFRDALKNVLLLLDEKDPSGDLKKHYMESSLDRLMLGSTYSSKISWLKLTSSVYLPDDFDWGFYDIPLEDSLEEHKKRG